MTALRKLADAPPIDIVGLALGYDGRPVFRHLDWRVAPGSMTAIVGANGSGKSTLLRGLVGELRPLEGRIVVAGRDRRKIAYLPQLAGLDRSFPITVHDVVAMGLWRKIGAFGGIGRHWSGEIDAALDAVGLAGESQTAIAHLSGGQMQRILFARLILQDADIVLLDEPFAAIDRETTADLSALIHRWHGEGRTIVAALHDLDQVRRSFPETLRLSGGRGILGPTAQMLSVAPLAPAEAADTRPSPHFAGGAGA